MKLNEAEKNELKLTYHWEESMQLSKNNQRHKFGRSETSCGSSP